jgi:hypothetical protein
MPVRDLGRAFDDRCRLFLRCLIWVVLVPAIGGKLMVTANRA